MLANAKVHQLLWPPSLLDASLAGFRLLCDDRNLNRLCKRLLFFSVNRCAAAYVLITTNAINCQNFLIRVYYMHWVWKLTHQPKWNRMIPPCYSSTCDVLCTNWITRHKPKTGFITKTHYVIIKYKLIKLS